MTNLTATVETVTPGMALHLLGNHEKNRNLRPRIVSSYARDMKAGRWHLNGESIKIDTSGNLIDGQHRLNAIIEADVPVQMMVVRGLPTEVMNTVDTGAKRMTSDTLAIRGEKYAAALAATARRMVLREQGIHLTHSATAPTKSEVLEWIDRNPEVRKAVEAVVKHGIANLMAPSALATAYFLMHQISPEQCEWFFARLADEDVPLGHPARTLRQKVVMARLKGQRINTDEMVAYTVRAWNAYRNGETPARLMLTRSGPLNNANFPVPR